MSDPVAGFQTEGRAPGENRRAVIDIGSNSVRLVVYDGPPRALLSIFNEKVLCGLGGRDPRTGELRAEPMARALRVLKRFALILRDAGNPPVTVFATAATRDAPNGTSFLEKVRATGLEPVVLSGAEEARFAALGILAGIPDVLSPPDPSRPNLAGDMGGGSLELVRYSTDLKDPLAERVSLPLGPLRLQADCGPEVAAARTHAREILEEVAWLSAPHSDTLYVVGGAWRAIAKVHMAARDSHLPVLQHYEIGRADAVQICDLLKRQGAESLSMMPGVQRSRIGTLPHAAMVLGEVLDLTRARRLVISSCGVREGVQFDAFPLAEQAMDPFLVLARDYARRFCPDPSFGPVAMAVMDPLFREETAEQRRLREAACLMSDIAAFHHPDFRADMACDLALRSPFIGVGHAMRVALAAALYQRYRARPTEPPGHVPVSLLDERLATYATKVGMTLKFLCEIMPKTGRGLAGCELRVEGANLVFRLPAQKLGLMGETPEKRLNALGEYLGLEALVRGV